MIQGKIGLKRLSGLVLWPAYFDSGKRRKEGRRVPLRLALENPTTNELLDVCKALSLKASMLEGKRYPRVWWDSANPILIETAGTKSRLLAHLATKLRESRLNTQRKSIESERKSKRR